MTGDAIPAGKLPASLLEQLLASMPLPPPDVRLGPALGEDACAIDLGDDLLVVAADPITLTSRDAGRYAVLVNANDIAVSGARPRWFLATVLLPPGTTLDDVNTLFDGLRRGLDDVGVALVGGHTEVTDAVRAPVVAGTMLGLARAGSLVTTGGARVGDAVVQIGTAPVEGAAVLAAAAADSLRGVVSDAVLAAAINALDDPGISVVAAALAAAELGATALHDPTEGGLASGLHELAGASGVAVQVTRGAVRWFEPGLAVCDAVGADPWATLASGCVLATFAQERAEQVLDALSHDGSSVSVIGSVEIGTGVFDETRRPIDHPARDEVARVLTE
jgi:hydrogenase maturation factor